jgi:hypothetical protein
VREREIHRERQRCRERERDTERRGARGRESEGKETDGGRGTMEERRGRTERPTYSN